MYTYIQIHTYVPPDILGDRTLRRYQSHPRRRILKYISNPNLFQTSNRTRETIQVMSFWFNLVKNALLEMLRLFWFGKRKISNSLSIYIKTNTGNTLSVELDPKWDIKNLKEIVAPRMGIAPEDIKIIFAGKELHNSTIIEVRARA